MVFHIYSLLSTPCSYLWNQNPFQNVQIKLETLNELSTAQQNGYPYHLVAMLKSGNIAEMKTIKAYLLPLLSAGSLGIQNDRTDSALDK
jgi:hypothetical protein